MFELHTRMMEVQDALERVFKAIEPSAPDYVALRYKANISYNSLGNLLHVG